MNLNPHDCVFFVFFFHFTLLNTYAHDSIFFVCVHIDSIFPAYCSSYFSRCFFFSYLIDFTRQFHPHVFFSPAMEISLRSTQKCDYALRIYISVFCSFLFLFHLICFSQPKLHGRPGIRTVCLRLYNPNHKYQCSFHARANTLRIDYFHDRFVCTVYDYLLLLRFFFSFCAPECVCKMLPANSSAASSYLCVILISNASRLNSQEYFNYFVTGDEIFAIQTRKCILDGA